MDRPSVLVDVSKRKAISFSEKSLDQIVLSSPITIEISQWYEVWANEKSAAVAKRSGI